MPAQCEFSLGYRLNRQLNLGSIREKSTHASDTVVNQVLDWVRMLGPSWTVRIVDNQAGSPNHFLRFIPSDMLPECFVKGTHHGKFQGPHSADFVRVPLVYLYGGASLDVGTYLTRHPERWMWSPLEDETSGVELVITLFYGSVLSNSFVAARKGNEWMKRW